jgi:hypothetical protein
MFPGQAFATDVIISYLHYPFIAEPIEHVTYPEPLVFEIVNRTAPGADQPGGVPLMGKASSSLSVLYLK